MHCSVHFLPADVRVEVPAGTLIHEAAIRAGLHDLELPCGGQGTCNECLVAMGARLVQALQNPVRPAMVVRVQQTRVAGMRVVGDSNHLAKHLLPEIENLSPLYASEKLLVPPASIDE